MGHFVVSLTARKYIANVVTLVVFMGCVLYYIYGTNCGINRTKIYYKSRHTPKVDYIDKNKFNFGNDRLKKISSRRGKLFVDNRKFNHQNYDHKIEDININKKMVNDIKQTKIDFPKRTFKEKTTSTATTSTTTTTTIHTSTTTTIRSTTVSHNSKSKHPVKDVWSDDWPRVNIYNCAHMEFMNRGINSHQRFKTWPYPRTGVVSFPGSGNTWTRHLIQQASGLWTGSVYSDRSLFAGGFLAELDECDDNSTVAVKAHFPRLDASSYCKFERVILVIRDPYRAVLSEFNWRSTSRHTGVADPRLFKSKLWKEHVVARTEKWMATTKGWIERYADKNAVFKKDENPYTAPPDAHKKLLLVSYERMKRNETKEMARMMKFLGLPLYRKQCVEEEADGNFHRKTKQSESISCLYERQNLNHEVEKRIHILLKFSQKLGIGNIAAEFEGPSGKVGSDKCAYLTSDQ
uniref:uncharacterized protein LOC120328782 isoform X1 n=1 Tax=Styela clava TaxID=7725 RepID=UPI001939A20B|nr:uncharacterized protein LOC120328782 isoform X1 [Styela clava]